MRVTAAHERPYVAIPPPPRREQPNGQPASAAQRVQDDPGPTRWARSVEDQCPKPVPHQASAMWTRCRSTQASIKARFARVHSMVESRPSFRYTVAVKDSTPPPRLPLLPRL